MHEIICPHCNKAFKIDEAGYADILKQVRDGAFEQQLHERLELPVTRRCAVALGGRGRVIEFYRTRTGQSHRFGRYALGNIQKCLNESTTSITQLRLARVIDTTWNPECQA